MQWEHDQGKRSLESGGGKALLSVVHPEVLLG